MEAAMIEARGASSEFGQSPTKETSELPQRTLYSLGEKAVGSLGQIEWQQKEFEEICVDRGD